MRLIDADKLYPDCLTKRGTLAISQSQIANAPTVEERPTDKMGKWVISEIRCPNCLEYFQTDCYSTEELKKCPNCGADMRKENKNE